MKESPETPDIEGPSFQTSILYWVGILEEMANTRFAIEMQESKSIVGRWRTLSILAEKDGLPITQLAQETFIERTALSRLLDQMEKEDLVQRRPRPDDRRTIEVYITAKGRRAFRKMLPVRRGIVTRAARGMPPEELSQLMKSIRTLVQNLSDDIAAPASAGRRPGGRG